MFNQIKTQTLHIRDMTLLHGGFVLCQINASSGNIAIFYILNVFLHSELRQLNKSKNVKTCFQNTNNEIQVHLSTEVAFK